ncbi:MAG: HAD-IIIC family phosphatase [Verrucomicrobiota bacterium]|nr:HAD-IIIC family phosphatase [Verrucomicrobiota bacterium]
MEKIKLVIWDLDETFWKGVLSEGEVNIITENVEMVKYLSKRGIINSISSKNSYDQAKKLLKEYNIWDYFIFPHISWQPKGAQIKDIINKSNLRTTNVLFLDDNILNLKEAVFYNKGLNIKMPDFIPSIKISPSCIGKDDSNLSRLKHYKIIETKNEEAELCSDNVKFLRESDITISFIGNLGKNKKRLLELLNRTNQLNFTKKRLSEYELDSLINNKKLSQKLIKAKDKYGDYGIIGFYSFNEEEKILEHFVFSCRILNMGIEQYVYSMLEVPRINIVPEIAVKLNSSKPDWIKETKSKKKSKKNANKIKILFKGGCDLSQMLHYLKEYKINIIEETNYVNKKNNFPIHAEHTQILLDSLALANQEVEYINKYIPFLDKNAYKTKIFKAKSYDILVYSVLMDYTQELYKHKSHKIVIPYGGYNNLVDTNQKQDFLNNYSQKNIDIDFSFFDYFIKNYEHIGQIRPSDFYGNLVAIRKKIPLNIPIIFINGAELNSPNLNEKKSIERHIKMNSILDKFIEQSDNCFLIDIRKVVTEDYHLTNNLRHYNRETYMLIAGEMISLIEKISKIKFATKKLKLLRNLKKSIINFISI